MWYSEWLVYFTDTSSVVLMLSLMLSISMLIEEVNVWIQGVEVGSQRCRSRIKLIGLQNRKLEKRVALLETERYLRQIQDLNHRIDKLETDRAHYLRHQDLSCQIEKLEKRLDELYNKDGGQDEVKP